MGIFALPRLGFLTGVYIPISSPGGIIPPVPNFRVTTNGNQRVTTIGNKRITT